MSDRRRVHFLGSSFGSRAACGRTILGWRSDQPRWTSAVEEVTCGACVKAMIDSTVQSA